MMKKQFKQVQEFNEAFNVDLTPSRKNDKLRVDLLLEEADEYNMAVADNNRVEMLDAIGDILYILIGSCHYHGFTCELIERVFDEIHHSNKSKLDLDGTPILREDGKVMKGPNYFKPQIKSILEKHEG
mgnify:CR=1 FL=1